MIVEITVIHSMFPIILSIKIYLIFLTRDGIEKMS